MSADEWIDTEFSDKVAQRDDREVVVTYMADLRTRIAELETENAALVELSTQYEERIDALEEIRRDQGMMYRIFANWRTTAVILVMSLSLAIVCAWTGYWMYAFVNTCCAVAMGWSTYWNWGAEHGHVD